MAEGGEARGTAIRTVPQLEIASIAAGGAGVGRIDGMAVFVERTAPGDSVTVDLTPKGRFALGSLTSLVRASAQRVRPACAHYERDKCGGCQLQHLSYSAQLDAKRDIVQQTLRRIAKRVVNIDALVPSPKEWRYRNKLTLTLRRTEPGWIAGLRPYDDPNELFGIVDCLITQESVVAAWRQVLAAQSALPLSRELRGAVRATEGNHSFLLEGGEHWESMDRFAAQCSLLSDIEWRSDDGRTRRWPTDAVARPAADSFGQVNSAVGALLHQEVVRRVLAAAPRRVIDAYAGVGLTSARLAEGGVEAVMIELDRAATRVARAALGNRVRVLTAKVEDVLPHELPADAVVLNPPRGGVAPQVTAALEAVSSKPAILVYVSCDPATLARDLTRLPSYHVASATVFDMFPQTAHIETLLELRPQTS